jgi:hypothetical protein
MLDICEDYFMYRGWTCARLDGGTTRPRRTLDIRLFNQENSRTTISYNLTPAYQCYLISTKAGGLGVNLTGADTVIFLDSDYNPQVYHPLFPNTDIVTYPYTLSILTNRFKQWPAVIVSDKRNQLQYTV